MGKMMIELREPFVLKGPGSLGGGESGHLITALTQSFEKCVECLIGKTACVKASATNPGDSLLLADADDAVLIHQRDAAMSNGSTEAGRQFHSPLLETVDAEGPG